MFVVVFVYVSFRSLLCVRFHCGVLQGICWFDQLRSEAKKPAEFFLEMGRNCMQGLQLHASAARCARNFIGHCLQLGTGEYNGCDSMGPDSKSRSRSLIIFTHSRNNFIDQFIWNRRTCTFLAKYSHSFLISSTIRKKGI